MKAVHLFTSLLFLVLSARAQAPDIESNATIAQGIKFEGSLNWRRLLMKAKAENKHIFVDAYATWCGPCKWMDENVFNQKKVGDFFNEKFIAVKVQMDSTKNDDGEVRKWYKDAKNLMSMYNVRAFPTYLFFSPMGAIVHKVVGAKGVDEFIASAEEAMDPEKQYYGLLTKYRTGVRDIAAMKQLARSANLRGDKDIASQIAIDYLELLDEQQIFTRDNAAFMMEFQKIPKVRQIISGRKNKLNKLDISALFTEDNVNFARWFRPYINSSDKFFELFYYHAGEVDQMVKQKWFSKGFVCDVVTREEVLPKLYSNNKPITENLDWEALTFAIAQKYNQTYADEILLDAQLEFFKKLKNWQTFGRLRDKKIREYPPKASSDSLFDARNNAEMLNVDAWEVFEKCADKAVLSQALNWIELALELEGVVPDAAHRVDTKANILYKLGRVQEAIAFEEKAIELARSSKSTFMSTAMAKSISEYLAKMKKGQPTW